VKSLYVAQYYFYVRNVFVLHFTFHYNKLRGIQAKANKKLIEAIQNKDFGSRSPAKTQREIKAEPSFNPPRLLTGSSTRILKYVENLKRGSSVETRPPLADWAKRLF